MSTINLIPPQIKSAENNKKIFSLVFSAFFVLILVTVITYGALFTINYLTKNETAETNERLAEESAKLKNLEQVEKDVNEINAKLQKISSLQKDRILWSQVLTDINHDTPEQLVIDSFTATTKDKKVTINGSGETRRDIVKLQEKLNTSNFFTNITFNTSNFAESEGMYTFTMSGELKK